MMFLSNVEPAVLHSKRSMRLPISRTSVPPVLSTPVLLWLQNR